jgi:hypothetical protein
MAAMIPEQLSKWLSEVLGDRLKCVMLHGSAVAGDFVAGESNYNLLVVIEPLGLSELRAVGPPLAAWDRAGHAVPILFSPGQLNASLDLFPIEMLDIKQWRRILFGSDLLTEVRVEPMHLRRAVERELTGKLLALRGKYAVVADNPRAVRELMVASLSTFLVLFRAALRVYETEVPETKLEATRALAKHIAFDAEPFERLFEMKQSSPGARRGVADVSFAAYLGAIEGVAKAINNFNDVKGSDR